MLSHRYDVLFDSWFRTPLGFSTLADLFKNSSGLIHLKMPALITSTYGRLESKKTSP